MLIRLLEALLINLFNGWQRGREARRRAKPLPALEVPTDHIVIGQVIAAEQVPAGEMVSRRLLQSGVVALSPEARRRHLYILGATGTGKTNLLLQLIEHDIRHQRAFCVIDLRGDLVDRILLRLAQTATPEKWRERLLLVDLRQEEWVTGFNPLQGKGNAYNRAFHVLSVLKQQSESWGVQLEETLRNSLIALAQSGWSLLEIEPLLTEAQFRQDVLAQVSDSRVKSFFARYGELPAATQLAWALAVINKVTPLLAIPQLRLMFGQKDTFSFRQLLDQQPGMIVLISLAVDRLHEAAKLTGGLFVSSLESAIMSRADQPESERVPAHLYVDEFESMATDRFETFIAEGRRFGLGLCLSHQNISQLSAGLRQSLRNNVHTQVYFQTGALDAADLAREISSAEPKEEVRTTLITQGVGEAYLVRRGQPSLRMKTKHCPDPAVSRSSVAAVRHASFATYARARAEAEADLEQREQRLNPAVAKSASGSDPTYTIRHDKLMHFKPRDSTDKPSEQPSDANAPLDRSLGDAGRNSPVEGAKPAGKMRQGATGEIPHDNQSQTEHSDPGAKPISKVRKTKSAPSKDQNISDRSGEKVKDARSSSKKATAGKSKQKSQHIGDESAPDGETEPPQ